MILLISIYYASFITFSRVNQHSNGRYLKRKSLQQSGRVKKKAAIITFILMAWNLIKTFNFFPRLAPGDKKKLPDYLTAARLSINTLSQLLYAVGYDFTYWIIEIHIYIFLLSPLLNWGRSVENIFLLLWVGWWGGGRWGWVVWSFPR